MSGMDMAGRLLWAFQAADGQDAAPPWSSLALPMAAMMAAFYFIILMPENRKNKQRQSMLAAMKKGDQVLTNGGALGVVANVKEETVTLKVDEARGITMEFTKASIVQVLRAKGGEAEEVKDK